MNYEKEINELKSKVAFLQQSVIQNQRNETSTSNKVDDTTNKVDAITPYSATKQAYIGDTELVFDDVPQGTTVVYGLSNYNISNEMGELRITFSPLDSVTDVTINVFGA